VRATSSIDQPKALISRFTRVLPRAEFY
jgi:hypothetical protein